MKIAITSDIHNNEVNLKKVLNYCKNNNIQTIICCGDLASKETLDFMNDNFSGNILYTFGNADYDDLRTLENEKKYRNTYTFKKFGEAIIEKKNVAFVHYPEEAKGLARSGKYDFVFYGHTHMPWTEKVVSDDGNVMKETEMLNPGNVSNQRCQPTFAVWDSLSEKFQLIRINELK